MIVGSVYRIALASALIIGARSATAQQIAVDQPRTSSVNSAGILSRPVTVQLDGVDLAAAINAVAKSAGVRVQYPIAILNKFSQPITLHAKQLPLRDALDHVLSGTTLRVTVLDNDLISIKAGASETRAEDGIVTGKVVDAKTDRPLKGVTIFLDDEVRGVQTADDGTFRLTNVRAGTHRIHMRLIGYLKQTKTITVADDKPLTVNVALQLGVNTLSEVVTTASGDKRRLEVGNAISHINVDSIARTAPILSVTDLLTARATGVQIIQSNGMVGSGASIRIRGLSSLALNSDPIVIVDGIRQDNNNPIKKNSASNEAFAPNRINDIDVNQIETIDILKGPAAATEYGTDAANGVIVIKTKRGVAGKTLWNASGERGWSSVPSKFDDFYYTYGHLRGTNTPTRCTIGGTFFTASIADSSCVVDSVVHANPLNSRATSILTSGLVQSGSADVSGGTDAVRFFFGLAGQYQLGTTQLPPVFRKQALALGYTSESFDPNKQTQRSGRANVSAQLTRTLELVTHGAYMSTKQVSPPGSRLPQGGGSLPIILDSAHFYGYTNAGQSPLTTLGSVQREETARATGGGALNWRPTDWLTAITTGGIDHGSQANLDYRGAEVSEYAYGAPGNGYISLGNVVTDVLSADTRLSARLQLTPSVHSTSSFGLQYAKTTSNGVTGTGQLSANSASSPTLNSSINQTSSQQSTGQATAGGYFEQQIAFMDRVFLTGALRMDGGSGFGKAYNISTYPKLSASVLALDRNGTTIRFRGAFGAAGVQPQNGASLQLYQVVPVYIDGVNVTGSRLTNPGNVKLKPERSREFEGGIDIGILDSRFNLELTGYSKRTNDAFVNVPLGATLNSYAQQQNVGDVQNKGIEATLSASLIRSSALTWDVTVRTSHNSNKLIRLSPNVSRVGAAYQGSVQEFREGYPLYGYWQRRATFADSNGNGLLSANEIVLEDTASYVGPSQPKLSTGISNQIGLFRGMVMVAGLFDIRSGHVLMNSTGNAFSGSTPAQNDLSTPLALQARATATAMTFGNATSLNFDKGWMVRFRELSTTYNVPAGLARKLRGRALSVTFAVRNVALWSHYTGLDPEVSDAGYRTDASTQVNTGAADIRNDTGAIPLPRTWLLRFNAGF